jgi:hypothetical protein
MIAICSATYDTYGWRAFAGDPADNDAGNRSGARRVSRTATLDGGCVITDGGYTDSDRTLTVSESSPSLASLEFARHVCANCPLVWVCAPDGCYLGVPDRFAVSNGALKISILIQERLDA